MSPAAPANLTARAKRRRLERRVHEHTRRGIYSTSGVELSVELWQQRVAKALRKLGDGFGYGKTRRRLLDRARRFEECATWVEVHTCVGCGERHGRLLSSCDLRVCPWCCRAWATETRDALILALKSFEPGADLAGGEGLRMLTFGHPFDPESRADLTANAIRARIARLKKAARAVWTKHIAGMARGAYMAIETAAGGLTHVHMLWWGYHVDLTATSEALATAQKIVPGLQPQAWEAQAFGAVRGARSSLVEGIIEAVKYPLKGPKFEAVGRNAGWFVHPELAAAVEVACIGTQLRGGFGELRKIGVLADSLREARAAELEPKACACGAAEFTTDRVHRSRARGVDVRGVVRQAYSDAATDAREKSRAFAREARTVPIYSPNRHTVLPKGQ